MNIQKCSVNGKKIHTSEVRAVENSLIAIGFSYSTLEASDKRLDKMATYQRNSDGIRRLGSAAADAVYVACGRFEAFVEAGLAAWDIAAGSLIIQRAGGRVSDHSGGEDYLFGRSFVATNGYIYDEFMKMV